jgi:23S rRNA (cytidine1920-2'-O)/16S rRNA (cytidine1409-2'-O)-methyltransferase
VPSPLPGPSGNREYFWWLRAGDPGRADGAVLDDSALEDAAAAAVAWQPGPGGGPPPVVLVAPAASDGPRTTPDATTPDRPLTGGAP